MTCPHCNDTRERVVGPAGDGYPQGHVLTEPCGCPDVPEGLPESLMAALETALAVQKAGEL